MSKVDKKDTGVSDLLGVAVSFYEKKFLERFQDMLLKFQLDASKVPYRIHFERYRPGCLSSVWKIYELPNGDEIGFQV